MSTATVLKAECRTLDLLPRATLLLTHPSKAIRQAASSLFDVYLGVVTDADQNEDSSFVSNEQLKTILLDEFKFALVT